MSDGLSWAAERADEEFEYQKHVASGQFRYCYLEQDLARLCTKEEVRLLVTRLIIHQLGGFKKYLQGEQWGVMDVFHAFSKGRKKAFLVHQAQELGLEIGQTAKVKLLRKKVNDLQSVIETWLEK